jgi:hypothetical protein
VWFVFRERQDGKTASSSPILGTKFHGPRVPPQAAIHVRVDTDLHMLAQGQAHAYMHAAATVLVYRPSKRRAAYEVE